MDAEWLDFYESVKRKVIIEKSATVGPFVASTKYIKSLQQQISALEN